VPLTGVINLKRNNYGRSKHNVKTYKEHKALMKKGCGHKKPKDGGKEN
jgi:hypothetical protein